MFQLFELILASPIGAFLVAGLQDTLYAVLLLSDCDDCGFNDLGKLLFDGLILAAVVGVVISIVRQRVKHGRLNSSDFVSIRSVDRK